jgi:hypothetical protein
VCPSNSPGRRQRRGFVLPGVGMALKELFYGLSRYELERGRP